MLYDEFTTSIEAIKHTEKYFITSGIGIKAISIIGCIKLERTMATIPHIKENSRHI